MNESGLMFAGLSYTIAIYSYFICMKTWRSMTP